jgi:hypothetical protein
MRRSPETAWTAGIVIGRLEVGGGALIRECGLAIRHWSCLKRQERDSDGMLMLKGEKEKDVIAEK